MSITYKQETKNTVRHMVIRRAVEMLTTERAQASCVRHSYVRDIYDYYNDMAESHEQDEVRKIDISYIQEWENMHANSLGTKRPEELSVCYLAGPEPENDFAEFVSMGIKPQNIWAFECERNTYLQALTSIDSTNFMQPKLIKTSIERFFESSPKTFDIVYIDACASLISDQHALRCIASMFKYHRLSSPGILISNFAYLDEAVETEKQQYIDIISRYNFIRDNRNACLVDNNGETVFNDGYGSVKKNVEEDLEDAYGNFITAMICNTASISIPSVRFCNSNYLRSLSSTQPVPIGPLRYQDVNTIKDNTLYKYLAMNCFLKQTSSSFEGVSKIDKLISEISAPSSGFDLLSSSKKLYELKVKGIDISPDINDTLAFFDQEQSMYQFLDKPNRLLFYDAVISQLSHPMHYVSDKALRLTYVAKQKRMFTDLMLFDECRYLYDWLPATHQIPNAFSNPSWQYTFRFALDGLIKQRMNYNNEFFFQGSVVRKTVPGFEAKLMPKRIKIN